MSSLRSRACAVIPARIEAEFPLEVSKANGVYTLGLIPQTGWGVPTGTLRRAAINSSLTPTASATYQQAELSAIISAIVEVRQMVNALVTDLRANGIIGN